MSLSPMLCYCICRDNERTDFGMLYLFGIPLCNIKIKPYRFGILDTNSLEFHGPLSTLLNRVFPRSENQAPFNLADSHK